MSTERSIIDVNEQWREIAKSDERLRQYILTVKTYDEDEEEAPTIDNELVFEIDTEGFTN